jgi:glycosyltransferase involved in cell wall biosynthesis
MRIAILTAWYPSKKSPLYGIFVQNQAKALSAKCSVYVLLLKWSLIPYVKERKEGNLTIIEKGDFYFPNASEHFLNFWASRYLNFFKTYHLKNPFDLIHCHDHYGAFVSDKIKNKLSIPYVCTIHNSNIMNDKLVGWKKSYLHRILSNANKVISVSKKMADVLTQKYQIRNIKVVPNYIDTNLFNIKPGLKQNHFKFIFVGGLIPNKGIVELVKAFHQAKMEGASLQIIGSGHLKPELSQYIKENRLQDIIKLIGEIPNQDLPKFYNAANVCISVSEYETFGLTILEAMSCGLPILYTASGGPNELVEDFAGVKITDRSIDGIVRGLMQIKEQYASFDSEQIRDHVIKYYGVEKSIGILLTVYKNVLDA